LAFGSGIAVVRLMYVAMTWFRRVPVDMTCLYTIARYLLYAFLFDLSLELLDLLYRIYEADESFKTLDFMVHTRLFVSQIVLQIIAGTLVPIALLGAGRFVAFRKALRTRLTKAWRR
jgi:hypothetical protein